MQWNYDFSNEEEYGALEDMLDGLTDEEITAIHKTVQEVRDASITERKQNVRRRFECCIIPILIEWARSAHATLEIKEGAELYFEAAMISAYGFNMNRDKWKRSLFNLADEINMEVFDNSVLLELIYSLRVE